MTSQVDRRLAEAIAALAAMGLPKAQQNERSALCLLALLDLPPSTPWHKASARLIGITPIMDWARQHFRKDYAPNTRETFRRQSMQPFVQAGIALHNPDQPARPTNSPNAVYQVSPPALAAFLAVGKAAWPAALEAFLAEQGSLSALYAGQRQATRVPVQVSSNDSASLSPGTHSMLIRDVVEAFVPRFAPGSALLYLGDTGGGSGRLDRDALALLGVDLAAGGKMPDVVLHFKSRHWLLLVEAVSSHGPVDPKRHIELKAKFGTSTAGLVFVTAFANRTVMARYLGRIAWETEVWVADAPSHLIHFNGQRFLGPYDDAETH